MVVSWPRPAAELMQAFIAVTFCLMTPTSYVVPQAGATALQHLRGDVLAVLGRAGELLRAPREAGCVRAAVLGRKGD